MIFQEMKLGTSVIPHFHVILTGQSISETILIIQGHLQGQKVNFKAIPLFHGILTGKSIYIIILGIQGHLQDRKIKSRVKM